MSGTQEEVAVPRLSVGERDRRYRLVRERMDREGLDVLILPANVSRWEQMMADSRYITTIGGFGTETLTIFPRDGEVTAYVFNRAVFWKAAQGWVADVRDGRNHWADNAIERLGECATRPRRIGISGLAGLIRAPDGIVPWTTVERIKKAFPNAEFVDATRLIQETRAVKSAEEVALMRRSASIIEAMVARMIEVARPGVRERDIYGAMVHTLLTNDGEQPSMLIFGTGLNVGHGQFVPTSRVLQRGDLLVNEIEARYAGYSAQAVAPASVGPASDAYLDLFRVAHEAFEAVRAVMTPGTPLGTLMDVYTGTIERAGRGRYRWAHPIMHARGLGDESPALLGDDDLERFRRVELQEGMTFIVKPRARGADGLSAQIGDTVVVTPGGGERLGKRALSLAVIG
ncbi:MAG TPA: Xaa-Pro peptidase family protein [Stellaceae bacterium]|nr:Xaa-Pro peptidase family protein [Stellaceae bacterium]